MVGWRGTGRERGGAYAFAPQRPSAVSMLGWVGHRNGDRDCEPAELTEHQARDGGKLGRVSPAYRAPEPRHGRPMAGFCYTRKGQDAERLGVSTYCGEVPKLGGATEPRVKKKLESIARSLETLAARRAKQLGKLPKAPRVRSR